MYEPWGRCNPTRTLEYYTNYTTTGCAIECRLHKVVEACSCKPYYYPGNFPSCTFDQLNNCAYVEIGKKIGSSRSSCKMYFFCVFIALVVR